MFHISDVVFFGGKVFIIRTLRSEDPSDGHAKDMLQWFHICPNAEMTDVEVSERESE